MTALDEPQVEHDLRCPELTHPGLYADPDRCTCRDADGHTKPERWVDGPLAPFDLETTGQDPMTAHVVTATVIRINWPNGDGRRTETTNWLADPGVDIPAGATEVHGITTEHARAHGRPLAEVVGEVCAAVRAAWGHGYPVIGHNVSYDLTVLAQECSRLGLRPFEVAGPVVDTIVLDRGCDRYRKGKRTLTAACAEYGVRLSDDDAHSSDADALAAARLAWQIARRYPQIATMPLDELQRWQAAKHRAWANGFGAYLRSQGKPDDVAREWPLRSTS